MDLEKGTHIYHFKILSPLGAGGMGKVYLAEDTRLNRKVAIKFLHEELSHDADKLNRFVQEAQAASALNHPNILTVYEIGKAGGKNYIATEFIEGKTLREHLMTHEPRRIGAILEIAIQVSEALSAAHRAGIIHRDIKPENIMIRHDGYAKILDFGLAKLLEKKEADDVSHESETKAFVQTVPGMIMGTVSYMSPEQARGRQTDERTDIWSLGIIFYELLTGSLPFTGETINHTIVSILERELPPLCAHDFQIPSDLERIILLALAKNAESRYQTAAELVEDLKTLKKRLEFEAEFERNNPTLEFGAAAAAPRQTEVTNTIAVLPFINMSRDENGDYFSDGLAEELLNVLSKIRGLQVAARTSAFSFKGKQKTVHEIGRVLNVASVLEGSVRIAGNRVRISVQLVKVADGYQLWSETYDRTMDDIFAVQDDIAQSVVEELRATLLGEKVTQEMTGRIVSEVAEAVKGRADDPEAQRLMLLGRHFLDRTTRDETAKAIGYFRQALSLDEDYALCWAELGRAYSIEAGRGWIPVEEGFNLAREAANRALLLEPELAEGHALLGRIKITHDWDFLGAESSFGKALKLAPGNSSVLDGAGILAYKLGRFEDALELIRQVLAQDPLSAAFWHNLGLTCHAAGKFAEAEKAFRTALELSPQRFVSQALLALVLMDEGQIENALAQARLEPDEFWRLWSLSIIYFAANRKSDSDDALRILTASHADGNAYQLAEVQAMRGEADAAFAWLEKAFAERDPGMTHAKVNPRFHALYDERRWAALLKKIGFAE